MCEIAIGNYCLLLLHSSILWMVQNYRNIPSNYICTKVEYEAMLRHPNHFKGEAHPGSAKLVRNTATLDDAVVEQVWIHR